MAVYTGEVGLSKAKRCSGLLPETQIKTARVSLSFLLDVSVGPPSEFLPHGSGGCFPVATKNDPCSKVLKPFQSVALHRSACAPDQVCVC